jgi:hypothetical protein
VLYELSAWVLYALTLGLCLVLVAPFVAVFVGIVLSSARSAWYGERAGERNNGRRG